MLTMTAIDLSVLTPKERECAELLGQGSTAKEIAGHLCVTRGVVDGYLVSARQKLRLPSSIALAVKMAEIRTERRILEPSVPYAYVSRSPNNAPRSAPSRAAEPA